MVPHEWLMAEVDELSRNQARPCSVCQRRTRFLPTRLETLMRAAGRGFSDRCMTCVLAPDLVAAALEGRLPSAEYRRGVRQQQAEAVLQQIADIEQLPPSAECEQALTMLYLQLQVLAEELTQDKPELRVIEGGKTEVTWLAGELPLP